MRFKKGSGMPISIPVIEMIEIGAGAARSPASTVSARSGSARHSAGSEPGPAGLWPRWRRSDRHRRQPASSAGSTRTPSGPPPSPCRRSGPRPRIAAGVGRPSAWTPTTAAVGIAEVVDENMTNAARVHAVEHGKDLDGFTMVAFGGGAPLHATRLMDKLGLDELIVPPGAGVGSAIGFLRAPFAYEAVRQLLHHHRRLRPREASRVLADLAGRGRDLRPPWHRGDGHRRPAHRRAERGHALQGPGLGDPGRLPVGSFDRFAAEMLGDVFTKAYEEFFGRAIDDLSRSRPSAGRCGWPDPGTDPTRSPSSARRPPGQARRSRPMFDPVVGDTVDAAVVERRVARRRRCGGRARA